MDRPPTPALPRLLALGIFFGVTGALLPQALEWDGLAFLLRARPPLEFDLAHPGYVLLVRTVSELGRPLGWGPETSARLLSALGAGLVCILLWNAGERRGLASATALLGALAFSTSLLPWRQAAVIEPSTVNLALLLVARRQAERYGSEASPVSALRLALALSALVSTHVVSILTVPWVLRGVGRRARRPELWSLAFSGLLLFGVALLLGLPGRLIDYARGFSSGPGWRTSWGHVEHAASFLFEGAPLLCMLGLPSLFLLRRVHRGQDLPWLVGPHLAAFLLFGKPVVAQLLPLFLALALALAGGLVALESRLHAPLLFALVLVALGAQTTHALRVAFHKASAPDPRAQLTLHWANQLSRQDLLIAGPLTQHLRWFTDVDVVALPELLHEARSKGSDEIEFLRNALDGKKGRTYARRFVTPQALQYLVDEGLDPGRVLPDTTFPVTTSPAELLPLRSGP